MSLDICNFRELGKGPKIYPFEEAIREWLKKIVLGFKILVDIP